MKSARKMLDIARDVVMTPELRSEINGIAHSIERAVSIGRTSVEIELLHDADSSAAFFIAQELDGFGYVARTQHGEEHGTSLLSVTWRHA